MSGPHDRFIHYIFSQPEQASAELRVVLPPRLVAGVDWGTFQSAKASVVDPKLKLTRSDLMYTARLKDSRAPLLFVLEHQSKVDRYMAARVERYRSRLREHWRQEHPKSKVPPAVVAMVLYHGKGRRWRVASLEQMQGLEGELLRDERVRRLLMHPEYALDDLTLYGEEELLTRHVPALVRLALVLLRYVRTRELNSRLGTWVPLFQQVWTSARGWEDLTAIVRYLEEVGDEVTDTEVRRVLYSLMPQRRAEELMQTMGQRMKAEGRAEGLTEGRAEGLTKGRAEGLTKGRAEGLTKGRAEDVLRILVARGVRVDARSRRRILDCKEVATLDLWFDRALSATRLSDLFSAC